MVTSACRVVRSAVLLQSIVINLVACRLAMRL